MKTIIVLSLMTFATAHAQEVSIKNVKEVTSTDSKDKSGKVTNHVTDPNSGKNVDQRDKYGRSIIMVKKDQNKKVVGYARSVHVNEIQVRVYRVKDFTIKSGTRTVQRNQNEVVVTAHDLNAEIENVSCYNPYSYISHIPISCNWGENQAANMTTFKDIESTYSNGATCLGKAFGSLFHKETLALANKLNQIRIASAFNYYTRPMSAYLQALTVSYDDGESLTIRCD